MPEYRQTAVSGTMRRRSNVVQISNELGATPSIRFVEEDVVDLNGVTVKTPVGGVVETFTNPTETFPLVNPVDNTLLGSTVAYQDAYVLMYSLYLYVAGKRDAGTL